MAVGFPAAYARRSRVFDEVEHGLGSRYARYLGLPWIERPAHHKDLTFERLYASEGAFRARALARRKRATRWLALSHCTGATSRSSQACVCSLPFRPPIQARSSTLWAMSLLNVKTGIRRCNSIGRHSQEPASSAGRRSGAAIWVALYGKLPALYAAILTPRPFAGSIRMTPDHCVLSYMRSAGEAFALVVLNFSEGTYRGYVVGVPREGTYHVVFASDAREYGGNGETRLIDDRARRVPCMGFDSSIALDVAALTGVVITLA